MYMIANNGPILKSITITDNYHYLLYLNSPYRKLYLIFIIIHLKMCKHYIICVLIIAIS